MRIYLETLDQPAHFWDGVVEDTTANVTSGTIGGESTTEVSTYDDNDAARAAVVERALELLDEGWQERAFPEHRYEPDPQIAHYFREELLEEWKSMGVEQAEAIDYRDRCAEYYACEFPEELDQFLSWRSSHQFGFCNFGEWRIWDQDLWLPRAEDGNLFEQLVLLDQQNVLGTAMMQYFASWLYLGSTGNGDVYFAHPDRKDPGLVEVIFFDHEEMMPTHATADSIGTLAWANKCYVDLGDEDVDEDEWKERFALLDGRAHLTWHYQELCDEADLEPEYEGVSDGRYNCWAMVWADCLLRQNGFGEFEEIGKIFYDNLHSRRSFDRVRRRPSLKTDVTTALYWLWRLFFFDKPELDELLTTTEDHASPIVRDCVSLIREFQNGRKELGSISDIFELRDRFIALDLDPDRAAERAAEQEAAEAQANSERDNEVARATALVEEASLDDLRAALWEFEYAEAREILFENLSERSNDDALWLRRWDFIANRGSSRDGKGFDFEDEELWEIIRRGHGAVIAPLLGDPSGWEGHDWRWLGLAAAVAPEQMLPYLLKALEHEDEFRRAPTAAAKGLEAVGDPAHVPALVAAAKRLDWGDEGMIAAIGRSRALLAVVEALGTLGGDEARDGLLHLLANGPDKVRPRVLVSLGRIGDPTTVDAVAKHLDSEVARPALFALAHIGTEAARESIDAHLSNMAGKLLNLAYERAMQQMVYLRTGADVDWELVDRLNGIVEKHKYDDVELHETLAAMGVAHPDQELAEARLRAYLHHEYPRVRTQAIEGLKTFGIEPELRWFDRPAADAAWEKDGVEGLRAAMQDPNTIFRHNALRKAVDEGVADQLSDEAIALSELYCRFPEYTEKYPSDTHKRTDYLIRALAQVKTEAADRRLCALWKSSNPMYSRCNTFKYDHDGLLPRLEPYVAEVEAELAAKKEASAAPAVSKMQVVPFIENPWLYGGPINGMDWSSDGSALVVAGQGGVALYDAQGNRELVVPATRGGWIYDAVFSPDGAYIAAGAHGGHLFLIDASAPDVVRKFEGHSGVPNGVRKVQFSPDGTRLASVSDDQSLRVWDVETGECTAVWQDPHDVNTVDWVDDDTVVIGTDKAVRLVSAKGKELKVKKVSKVAEVRVDRERDRIYAGTAGSKIHVFTTKLVGKAKEAIKCAAVARIRRVDDGIVAASWEGDEPGLHLIDFDGSVCWLDGHQCATFALDVHPVTGEIAAGGKAKLIARWHPDGNPVVSETIAHSGAITSVRECGDEIVTASHDKSVIRWDRDGKPIARYVAPGRVFDAVIDGDHIFMIGDEYVACRTLDDEVVWEANHPVSYQLHLTDDAVVSVAYDQLLWIDRATGEVLGESGTIEHAKLHWDILDDGRIAVVGWNEERVSVWDPDTRKALATCALPPVKGFGSVWDIAAVGDRIFVGRRNDSLVAIDANSGDIVTVAKVDGWPKLLAANDTRLFNADGRRVEIYDVKTLEHLETLDVGSGSKSVRATADGGLLIGQESGDVLWLTPAP